MDSRRPSGVKSHGSIITTETPACEKFGSKSLTTVVSGTAQSIHLHMPCIGKGLYLSGICGVTSRKILKQESITHVLNLAREMEHVLFPDFVNVQFVGLRDSLDENLLEKLPGLVNHIHEVVESGGNIVVCCVAGVSRSVAVCLAYKVLHEGLDLREAFDQVRSVRPLICPNVSFWEALLKWEKKIKGENSVRLMPYICGMVPELDTYQGIAETRIKHSWMRKLLVMWVLHILLFVQQIIVLVHDKEGYPFFI